MPLINLVARLASRHYRVLIQGAIEYGWRAAARDERTATPPPPPVWKHPLQAKIDNLTTLTGGIIDLRVLEQGVFWVDQHAHGWLLEDMTYTHLRNVEAFLLDTADTWYHYRKVEQGEAHRDAWIAILGHVPDAGQDAAPCDQEWETKDEWGNCPEATAWMNERPLLAHIRRILADEA